MNPSVYLAGPITGVSWGGATDWRTYAKEQLAPEIVAFSPLRRKDYLAELPGEIRTFNEEWPLSTSRGIMTRDRYDVMHRDIILANLLGAERVSIGTVMEFAWADMTRTPVVLVMEEHNIHDHPMVREAIGYRVETLDEGIAICKAILIG